MVAWPFCDTTITAPIPPPPGYPDEPTSIGEHLRKRRMDVGLTQTELARMLGANQESVRNWERGHTAMAVRFYPRVLEFLGYDPAPEPETFGQKVRAKRMKLGLTLGGLARELGVDESSVWRVEHDGRVWKRELGRVFGEFVENSA